MNSKKVGYSTAAGPYCTTHEAKVPFCMPDFSRRKIIFHRFHVDNNEVELVVGYDIIIRCKLMVQIGL